MAKQLSLVTCLIDGRKSAKASGNVALEKEFAQAIEDFDAIKERLIEGGAKPIDADDKAFKRVQERIQQRNKEIGSNLKRTKDAIDGLLWLGSHNRHMKRFFGGSLTKAQKESVAVKSILLGYRLDMKGGTPTVSPAQAIHGWAGAGRIKLKMEKYERLFGPSFWGSAKGQEQFYEAFVRALDGEDISGAEGITPQIAIEIRGMAEAKKEYDDWAIASLNKYGAMLEPMDISYFKQNHNLGFINADRETWKRELAGWLNWSKMIDYETGLPLDSFYTDADRLAFLDKMLTDIVDDSVGGARKGGGNLLQQQKRRILHFKSNLAQYEYDKKYGKGLPLLVKLDTQNNELANMLGRLQVLGPDPEITIRTVFNRLKAKHVQERLEARATKTQELIDGGMDADAAAAKSLKSFPEDDRGKEFDSAAATAMTNLDYVTGDADIPMMEASAKSLATVRQVISPLMLYRAALMAIINDRGTSGNHFARIGGQNPWGKELNHVMQLTADLTTSFTLTASRLSPQLNRFLQTFLDRYENPEVAKAMSNAGIIDESVYNNFAGGGNSPSIERFSDFNRYTPKWAQAFALGMFRVSGLTPMTTRARMKIEKQYHAQIFAYRDMAFDEFKADPLTMKLKGKNRELWVRKMNLENFGEFLNRSGIDAERWDAIRKGTVELDGGGYVDIRAMIERGSVDADAAIRLKGAMEIEKEFAIPTTNPRVKAIATGRSRPGTMAGEVARTVTQFTSHPIGRFMYMLDNMNSQRRTTSNARYMARLLAVGMVTGAITIALRRIAEGKKMDDVTKPEFWYDALLMSGTLGMAGDIFRNARYRQKALFNFTGPSINTLYDIGGLTAGNLAELAQGEDTDFVKELIQFGDVYIPSTFYTRQFQRKYLYLEVARLLDPEAYDSLERKWFDK